MKQTVNIFQLRTLISTLSALAVAYYLPKIVAQVIAYKKARKPEGSYKVYDVKSYTKITNYILLVIVFGSQSLYYQGLDLILVATISTLAIVSMQVDQKIRIIPNEIVFSILGLAFIRQSYVNNLEGLLSSVIAMVLIAVVFYVSTQITSTYFGQGGVGAGDVKLTIAMAAFFGSQQVLIFMMCIAAVLLTYIAYGFIFKKYTMKTTFPMGLQITYGFLFATIVVNLI